MDETSTFAAHFADDAPLSSWRPEPSTVALVGDTCWLLGSPGELADHFDEALLGLTPHAGGVLTRSFPRGRERLASALLRGVLALLEAPTPLDAEAQVRQLGCQLVEGGLPMTDLPQIGFALIRAVRASYRGEWSTTIGSAWTAVQAWLVEQLLQGAQDVPMSPVDLLATLPSALQSTF